MNQAALLHAERARARFDFLKKMKFAFWFMVRSRYKLNLVFRLSPVCTKFKLKFSAGIQIFAVKATSHGKPNLIDSFWRSDLPC